MELNCCSYTNTIPNTGQSKASATNLKPDRTIHTAQDMPDAATGHMHDSRNDTGHHKESRHG